MSGKEALSLCSVVSVNRKVDKGVVHLMPRRFRAIQYIVRVTFFRQVRYSFALDATAESICFGDFQIESPPKGSSCLVS